MPVINENDTVATQELRYGDNDRLAARVAAMISADCLLLLSDIDGLYSANPQEDKDAEFIAHIEHITPEIEAMAGGSGSSHGSGGMVTKLQAAQIAQSAGCHMVLASGRAMRDHRTGRGSTLQPVFGPSHVPDRAQKPIAHTLHPAATITMDDGAVAALQAGKSLRTTSASRKLTGNLNAAVGMGLVGTNGVEIGRGLAGLASDEARLMMGKASDARDDVLRPIGRTELVHRDDRPWRYRTAPHKSGYRT